LKVSQLPGLARSEVGLVLDCLRAEDRRDAMIEVVSNPLF
jgi:hypothetical protein